MLPDHPAQVARPVSGPDPDLHARVLLLQQIGSSPRVLIYLFGSKDSLVRELLARARHEELEALSRVDGEGLDAVTAALWAWLSAPQHRRLLVLWVETYARSLVEPDGAWAGFARLTVDDWLEVPARAQPSDERHARAGLTRRTRSLALLRGSLLDLLATGDERRVGAGLAGQGVERAAARGGVGGP